MSTDPRYGERVDANAVAGMAVVLKALVLRAGGRIELEAAELEAAAHVTVQTDADEERMVLQLVDGAPPDTPRFAAEPAQELEP